MIALTLVNSLDTLGWIMLFGGLWLYWLKKIDEVRVKNKELGFHGRVLYKKTLLDFADDNLLEVPISVFSCLALALLSPVIPPEIIDLKGYVSLLLIGIGGGSAINGIITKMKK